MRVRMCAQSLLTRVAFIINFEPLWKRQPTLPGEIGAVDAMADLSIQANPVPQAVQGTV